MANFTFTVDTSPMADQVKSVSHHVGGVQTAVVAMEAAVIATERESATKICDNVDRGFYFLVKSQISQKSAKLNSDVSSKLMVLDQLGKALQSVKKQMQNDFQMITSRYTTLFRSLDKSLAQRISELDKAAVKLAQNRDTDIFSRPKNNSCSFLTYQSEIVPQAQSLAASKMKSNAKKSIQFISTNLLANERLTRQLGDIVIADARTTKETLCIPVILGEYDSLACDRGMVFTALPELPEAWAKAKTAIEAEAEKNAATLTWRDKTADTAAPVESEFMKIVSSSDDDERTKKEMERLFAAAQWRTVSGDDL